MFLISFRNFVSHFFFGQPDHKPLKLSTSCWTKCFDLITQDPHSEKSDVSCSMNALQGFRLLRTHLWSLYAALRDSRLFRFSFCPAIKKRNKNKEKSQPNYRERRSVDATAFHRGPMLACVMHVKKAEVVVFCLAGSSFQGSAAGGWGSSGSLTRLWCRWDSHRRAPVGVDCRCYTADQERVKGFEWDEHPKVFSRWWGLIKGRYGACFLYTAKDLKF